MMCQSSSTYCLLMLLNWVFCRNDWIWLIPVSSLFFFLIIIWLVFKTVSENSCRFVLALSEHSECSELRLTDSGENQTHLFLLGERQSQVIYVWGESDNEGEGQQLKWCVLTLNCRKHLAWAAYASDEICASKCCNYLCISTQCNLLWG